MNELYDTAIVGAGINGCAAAHFLTKEGRRVALIDQAGIAAGGSGAAGAFVSPKFSKGGPLKGLMEAAYRFSMDFYRHEFTRYIRVAPLLHLAKYPDENERLRAFRQNTALTLDTAARCSLPLMPESESFERVLLPQSGLVDAKGVCEAMAKGADFFQEAVPSLQRTSRGWRAGSVEAKRIVVCTGAYRSVIELPSIRLRPVWGHRIDIVTSTPLPCHLHQFVSIAATDAAGRSAIGATHDVHYHPQTAAAPYDIEAGRKELLAKARRTLDLGKVEIVADYTGLRSGSNDYLPILGEAVDDETTFSALPNLLLGESYPFEAFIRHEGVFLLNGTGGYGFVLGPYLAQQLAAHLCGEGALAPMLDPARFTARRARREGNRS